MANVRNSEVIQALRNAAKVQGGIDKLPDMINPQIAGTIELNPQIVKNAQIVSSQTAANLNGNSTVYTTPTTQDFYLTNISLSIMKDVTADTTEFSLRASINGAFKELVILTGLTLTATAKDITMSFPHPIKIDRNTNILVNSSRTVGATRYSATIVGFLDETTNA